jgi:hypothetical protein
MGGERGLCGVGSAVRLCLPPGNGGAAGWVCAVAVWRRGGRQGGVPQGRGRGPMARESERGQQECCNVGGALVAGWDDNGGGCAVALLGR